MINQRLVCNDGCVKKFVEGFIVKVVALTLSRIQVLSFRKYLFALVALSILLVLPAIIHQQLITGSLVNATLLLSAAFIGPVEAIVIGLVPSVVALSSGTLPLPLAPAIPYIMVANALYIYTFHLLHKKNILGAAVVAAVLKYAFLYGSTHLILVKLLQSAIFSKVIVMMSWPQLVTALIGGGIAFLILRRKA